MESLLSADWLSAVWLSADLAVFCLAARWLSLTRCPVTSSRLLCRVDIGVCFSVFGAFCWALEGFMLGKFCLSATACGRIPLVALSIARLDVPVTVPIVLVTASLPELGSRSREELTASQGFDDDYSEAVPASGSVVASGLGEHRAIHVTRLAAV